MQEMSIEQYLEENKKIQKYLLDYLDNGANIEERYQNLINIFDDFQIHSNPYEMKTLFYLITKISNNHHREIGFFDKIEQILLNFKNDIKNYFTNSELFHIFKSNKRLLLFLFEEKIMIMDEFIAKEIINNHNFFDGSYPLFFMPVMKPFIDLEWFPKYDSWVKEIKKELPENFYEKRKIGENDGEICQLIQKDLIEEFIIYVNKNLYSINSIIIPSIYETNNFLIKKK